MGGAAEFGRERPEDVLGSSDESYLGAGAGKAVGEGLADTPRCPGDHYPFALQLHASRVRSAYGLGSDSDNQAGSFTTARSTAAQQVVWAHGYMVQPGSGR
jgi:hypothetical protein